MAESDKDLYVKSCRATTEYPANVVKHTTYKHNLVAYKERLRERADILFCSDGKAELDVWDCDDDIQGFQGKAIRSAYELKCHIEGEHLFDNRDPRCRFLFIHAWHSRDRLRISEKMLKYALTYHQVMPAFLDFIFPFGWQEYAEDFHFTGLRQEIRLAAHDRNLTLSELGRSGKTIQFCYALKSVERSSDEAASWSIRQTAVYHSFDVESGKALWVFVKGNNLIKERIQAWTESLKASGDPVKAFNMTLEAHLVLCDWCGEDWRWYINFLETTLQNMTRRSLAIRVTKAPSVKAEQGSQPSTPKTKRSRTMSWKSTISKTTSWKKTASSSGTIPSDQGQVTSLLPIYERQHSCSQALPSSSPPPPPPAPPILNASYSKPGFGPGQNEGFSMGDLQEIQHIEDKLNETLLVLNANTKVLDGLKQCYDSVARSADFSAIMKVDCGDAVARLKKRIDSIVSDLTMHHSRAETLLRLVADRKTLLYGILNYRTMEANRLLAKRAQESAERMEKLTNEMNDLARKTKQETVSMKVITLVTLFFLPGTFISTIMSTDIIKFQEVNGVTNRTFQPAALKLYLTITVPMMVLTFLGWRIFYKRVDRDIIKTSQKEDYSEV